MRRKAMVAALAAWGVMAGAALSGSVPVGDDGLHKPDWLKDSFRDVREDAAEAAAAGRVKGAQSAPAPKAGRTKKSDAKKSKKK